MDKWTQRPVIAPSATLPIDDEFIALAKAISANVFADATHIDPTENISPYSERNTYSPELYPVTAGRVLADLQNSASLCRDRTSEDTVVFWQRPDTEHLLDLIVARHKQIDATNPAADPSLTLTAFEEYLAKNYGWKADPQSMADLEERARGIRETIPLSKLPDDLRIPFETELRKQVEQIDSTPDYHSFELPFWKNARLAVAQGTRPKLDDKGIPLGEEDDLYLHLFLPGSPYTRLLVGYLQYAPKEVAAAAAAAQAAGPKNYTLATDPKKFLKAPGIMPIAPVTQQVPQKEPPGPQLDLDGENGLEAPVVFTAKHQPLAAFVAELQKQSGIALKLAPDSFPGALVSASSAGMKVRDAMKALQRLYVAHWKREGDAYILEPDHPDELHFLMAQMGVFAFYSSRLGFIPEKQRDEMGNQLAEEILGTLDPDQMKKAEGVPFSALSAELQQRVFALYRNDNTMQLLVAQQRLDDALAQDVTLHFSPLAPQTPKFFGRLFTPGGTVLGPLSLGATALAAYTVDGEFISELFPQFSTAKPTYQDQILLKMKLDAQKEKAEKEARPKG